MPYDNNDHPARDDYKHDQYAVDNDGPCDRNVAAQPVSPNSGMPVDHDGGADDNGSTNNDVSAVRHFAERGVLSAAMPARRAVREPIYDWSKHNCWPANGYSGPMPEWDHAWTERRLRPDHGHRGTSVWDPSVRTLPRGPAVLELPNDGEPTVRPWWG